jgi:hypothetical protein
MLVDALPLELTRAERWRSPNCSLERDPAAIMLRSAPSAM